MFAKSSLPRLIRVTVYATYSLQQKWFQLDRKGSRKKLLNQTEDSDQHVIFGDAMTSRRQNVVANGGPDDGEFIVNKNDSFPTTNESTVNAQTLERCLTNRIDRQMSTIVETIKDTNEGAILTPLDNIITAKNKLSVRSINESSGRDAANVTVISDCGEHIEVTVFFENLSERSNTLHELNINDETRGNNLDKVTEFSVPGTHFD